MICRFCGCTELTPCHMPAWSQYVDPETGAIVSLAGTPCGWLIPGVCYAPPCVDKAYVEAVGFVLEAQRYIEAGLVL